MEREGVYPDPEIIAALDWLSETSGDPVTFRTRIAHAQSHYRQYVSDESHLGKV
jgi:hypothetical protein